MRKLTTTLQNGLKLNARKQYERFVRQFGEYSAVLHLIQWLKDRQQNINTGATRYEAIITDLSKLYTERDLAVMTAESTNVVDRADILAAWSHIIEQYVCHNLDKEM